MNEENTETRRHGAYINKCFRLTVATCLGCGRLFFPAIICLTLFAGGLLPARAVELRDRATVLNLLREAAAARTPAVLDKLLRRAATAEAPFDTEDVRGGYGVIWFENGIPRAKLTVKGVPAAPFFRDVLADSESLAGIDLTGEVDVDLEIHAGRSTLLEGRLLLREVGVRWRQGWGSLVGVNGRIPLRLTLGEPPPLPLPALEPETVAIRALLWGDTMLASNLRAAASCDGRVLKFEPILLAAMGGTGRGSLVIDLRGHEWRAATMLRFRNLELMRLYELLPELPVLVRVTKAEVSGDLGLIYTPPRELDMVGSIRSTQPGVIELSPRFYEKVRRHLDSPVLRFQKLIIDIGRSNEGELEARVSLHRRTAQSIRGLCRGEPFAPMVMTLKVPIIPFVEELSQP